MSGDNSGMAPLPDHEAIRQLLTTYCRAVDRRDYALLRSVYANNAIDKHAGVFSGTADDFVAFALIFPGS